MAVQRCRFRSPCAILPPEILRRIASRGNRAQREAALATLATDQTLRLARATHQLLDAGARKPSLTLPELAKQR
ncbi:MAG: hypothetical protein KGJ25_02370, partial [Betaproteobacteria bacterium]|nr:hypothetical protein [Betaproteobacteria bacterium]